MILGLGIDSVRVSGLAEQLTDRASAFKDATFTADEIAYSESAASREPSRHLAARYAAKEAALKALDVACGGARIAGRAVPMIDIEVARDVAGRPFLRFSGAAAELAAETGTDRVWVSLTHDGDYATAVVVLERIV